MIFSFRPAPPWPMLTILVTAPLLGALTTIGDAHELSTAFERHASIIPNVARARLRIDGASKLAEKVLYTFRGTFDGASSRAPLVFDKVGNLYGTTPDAGSDGSGTVFELVPDGHGGWTEKTLYAFKGNGDGSSPYGPVVMDASGNLFGTTFFGGNASAHGTVYELVRQPGGAWKEKVLYRFRGGNDDGAGPSGGLVFDGKGNLFGTTTEGGSAYSLGTVFELTPTSRGWHESVLHKFTSPSGPAFPQYGTLVFDTAGNLYGTTSASDLSGTVFELTPHGGSWSETTLYDFKGGSDGRFPDSGVIFDNRGNLYGITTNGGPDDDGTVFELEKSGNRWVHKVLYSFKGSAKRDGMLPFEAPVFHTGRLYGTTYLGGDIDGGTVWQLTAQPHGGWSENILFSFDSAITGYAPIAGVTFDRPGNIYGITSKGGGRPCNFLGCGVVYELIPNGL